MSLIENVYMEMMHDSEDWAEQSDRLKDLYLTSSVEAKERLDDAFICLCGYSLHTLISGQD